MTTGIVVAATVISLIVGLLLNRRLNAGDTDSHDAEALGVTDLVNILPTICVLLLAFVLVESFGSWKSARSNVSAESNAMVRLAHEAHFVPEEGGAPIVRSLDCYSRAVQKIEWKTMGDRRGSTAPEYWLDRMSLQIEDLRDEGDIALTLVDSQQSLGEARQSRLIESLSSVPSAMYGLMLVSVLLSVIAMTMLTHGRVRRPIQLVALLSSTFMLAMTLLLIGEIDKPYSGPTAIKPYAIAYADREIIEELANYTTRAKPECDKRGIPDNEGSFTLRRERIV